MTVQMRQAAFAQDERVGLTVTVKNATEQVARLNATQFLGSATIGRYQFALTDAAGAKWAVARDPRAILSRVPVRLIPVTLKPGQSFAAKMYLPPHGMFFQKVGVAGVRVLPIEKYTLAIPMKLGGKAFAISAVAFVIRKQPKVTELPGALPKAKIIAEARVFFKVRPEKFKAANRARRLGTDWPRTNSRRASLDRVGIGRCGSIRKSKARLASR